MVITLYYSNEKHGYIYIYMIYASFTSYYYIHLWIHYVCKLRALYLIFRYKLLMHLVVILLLCKLISIQGYAIIELIRDRIIFYFDYSKIHLFEERSCTVLHLIWFFVSVTWSLEFIGNTYICIKYRYRIQV